MEAFYAPHELRDIGVKIAREAGNFDGEMRTLHQTALVRLLALPALAEHRDTLLTVIPPDLSEVFTQSLRSPDGTQLEVAGAGAVPHQEDHLYGNVDASEEMLARELIEKGKTFRRLQRPKDALATYDEVVRRFGASKAPALLKWVATALLNKGAALGTLQRLEDALAIYDEVLRRLGRSQFPPDPALIEYVFLEKAQCELECRRYESAMRTVSQVLEQCRPENFGNRVRGHLIRARVILASGDPSRCEQDIEALLFLLPELDALPRELLTALMKLSIELGPARMNALIQGSPAAPLLLPLTTALEQELGLTPRVAQEVDEVAQDIRRELEGLRNAYGRGDIV